MRNPPNLGTGEVPFPHARPTQARRDEDAFLEAHGSAGCVLLFRIADGIASGGEPVWQRVAKILRAARPSGQAPAVVSKQEHV